MNTALSVSARLAAHVPVIAPFAMTTAALPVSTPLCSQDCFCCLSTSCCWLEASLGQYCCAGAGCLSSLVHQQGPAAPSSQLQPALLAWLAQLPSSVPQQARALARSASRLGTRWPAALLLILAVSRVLDAAFRFKHSKRHWNCPGAGQASAGRVWHPCWLKAFKTRWQHCNGCPPPTAAAG